MRSKLVVMALGLALLPLHATSAQGSLARRVDAARDGKVAFHFASHASVCGDGERWFRATDGEWHGEWSSGGGSTNEATCERGPLRVTVTKDDGAIVRIETAAGPLKQVEGATSIGAVGAAEASAWLLAQAARLDGRPAREALLPAALADSSAPFNGLLTVARDQDRARDTRRSAISWLSRAPGVEAAEAGRALRAIAVNADDAPAVRESALSGLGRLARDGEIATLQALTRSTDDEWLSRGAMREIGRSGDPRARVVLRAAVTDAAYSEPVRISAITALGGTYASATDVARLRDAYAAASSDRVKLAILTAVGSVGGASAAEWLIARARDSRESSEVRRRAVAQAENAGAGGRRLSALFDAVTETDVRLSIVTALAEDGSAPSRTKLVAIAGASGEIASVRRRAVSALERFDGEDVRGALNALAVPPSR
jgi:hypothetical protein